MTKTDWLDEILAGLANYIVESIRLEPSSAEYRKLNQKQAKQAILTKLDEAIDDAVGELYPLNELRKSLGLKEEK